MTEIVTPNGEIVTPDDEIVAQARANAFDILSSSGPFHNLPYSDQQSIYLDTVDSEFHKIRRRRGLPVRSRLPTLSRATETDTGAQMGYKGYDPGFQGDTTAFKDLVDSVDFPQFVGDLLKAVFDANLKVMKEQTDSYIKLMKECTKSAAEFIVKVKDEETFAKLAESKNDQYNITQGPDGTISLTNPQGDKVDTEDAAVKKDILDTKIMMAKEHRAALREVLLMGVTRLVVEKGSVEAAVEFMITANRKSTASHKDQNINVTSLQMDYDAPLGGLFGGPSGSMSMTNTNIQVNTSQKEATDTLSAKLTGKVNIQFKTDYFKLDNFANMYADGGTAAFAPPGTQQPPGAPQRPGTAPALPPR
jgi:hypothetical protein